MVIPAVCLNVAGVNMWTIPARVLEKTVIITTTLAKAVCVLASSAKNYQTRSREDRNKFLLQCEYHPMQLAVLCVKYALKSMNITNRTTCVAIVLFISIQTFVIIE